MSRVSLLGANFVLSLFMPVYGAGALNRLSHWSFGNAAGCRAAAALTGVAQLLQLLLPPAVAARAAAGEVPVPLMGWLSAGCQARARGGCPGSCSWPGYWRWRGSLPRRPSTDSPGAPALHQKDGTLGT